MNALRVLKPLLQIAAWRLHVAIVLVSDYVCASNVRKAFLTFVSLMALQLHTECGNKIKNTLGQCKIDYSFKPMVNFMLTQKQWMLLLLFDSNRPSNIKLRFLSSKIMIYYKLVKTKH